MNRFEFLGVLRHDSVVSSLIASGERKLRHDDFRRTHHNWRRYDDDFRMVTMMISSASGNNTPTTRERDDNAN